MEIDRYIQAGGSLQDRRESGLVEELVANRAPDVRSDEPEFFDGALELGRGQLGGPCGQGCEGGEPIGMLADHLIELLIHPLGYGKGALVERHHLGQRVRR